MKNDARHIAWLRLFAATAVGALLFAAGGCGIAFLPQKPGGASPNGEAPSATSEPTAPTGGTVKLGSREDYVGKVDKAINCPGGKYDISALGGVYELSDDCTEITVSGTRVVLLARGIDDLTVSGRGNRVYAMQLGSVEVSGGSNVITWQSGSPVVNDFGTGNLIEATPEPTATPGPTTTPGTETAPPPAGETPPPGGTTEPPPGTTPPPTGGNTASPTGGNGGGGSNHVDVGSRKDYAGKVDHTIACNGGSYRITANGGVYEVKTNCTSIVIVGSKVVLLTQKIDAIQVVGTGNKVYTTTLGAASITGSDNVITWESGSPDITNVGPGNTTVQI